LSTEHISFFSYVLGKVLFSKFFRLCLGILNKALTSLLFSPPVFHLWMPFRGNKSCKSRNREGIPSSDRTENNAIRCASKILVFYSLVRLLIVSPCDFYLNFYISFLRLNLVIKLSTPTPIFAIAHIVPPAVDEVGFAFPL